MARVTVEDCVEKIPSRYELVVMAARRAKDISAGAPITLSRDNDKDAVVSLREIADGTIDLDTLKENVIHSFQTKHAMEKFTSDAPAIEDKDAQLRAEVDEAFESATDSKAQASEVGGDDSGMSFADENVDVED